jgi:alpha-tubulin suppressor-like RCC1 family protein
VRALRLLAVAGGLLALAAVAGSSRAERQSASASAVSVAAGLADTCALTSAGGVECWGYNGHDELGDGQTADSLTPVPVSGLASGVTSIAEGLRNACAITRGGGVKCWGAIYFGALGDGTTTRHSAPVDVAGLGSGVTAISAGGDDACAVTASGGAKCWGLNYLGQLGDGTSTDRPTPVDVSGLASGVTAITSGLNIRTCAIAAGGRVMCWGRRHLTPAVVSGLGTDVKAINALCALTAAGAVKCWGEDLAAVDVPGLDAGVTAIASSGNHSCALTSLGGAKCWGLNNHGQLGDGTETNRTTPVDVVGLHGPAAAIATGAFHTCAILQTGGVDCWGSNLSGQLGDGTTVDRSQPVSVIGFGTAHAAAKVTITSRRVLVTSRRIAAVAVRCASAAVCRGAVTLIAARTRLGSRSFSIRAGAAQTIRIVLTRTAFARLVRMRRLSARVSVTGRVNATRTVTLVAP